MSTETRPEVLAASDFLQPMDSRFGREYVERVISRACVAYAERVNVKAGVPINFCFCPRCGEQMNPNYDASATPTPTARAEKAEAERDDFHKLLLNREVTLKKEGERWVKAMTDRDAARAELSKLREDVKPLLAVLDSCNTVCDENPLRDFLEKHPELKEKA